MADDLQAEAQATGLNDASCDLCGLSHRAGELFAMTGHDGCWPIFDATCELEPAFEAAHAAPQPAGTVAYHVTDHERLSAILEQGLDPSRSKSENCRHTCLAATPEVAARIVDSWRVAHGIPLAVEFPMLEVDIGGLDLFFEAGEARHHDTVEPDRLRIFTQDVAPIAPEWLNPAWRFQHGDCLAGAELPLDRRILRSTNEEATRLWPDGNSLEQWRALARDLASAKANGAG
jgi:hypothetical protein